MELDKDHTKFGKDSALWLLGSLLISLLVLPTFEELNVGRSLGIAGYSLTMLGAAFAARQTIRATCFVFLIVALPTGWATLFVDSAVLFVAHCLIGSAFFWLVGGLTVYRVVKSPTVNFESVFGAISAYLLFGLAWALSYWAICAVAPQSFPALAEGEASDATKIEHVGDFSGVVYYSFVTMSSLGYGDITPRGGIARTLSWVQSVTGQFYLAIVIAWLVNALPRPHTKENETNAEPN